MTERIDCRRCQRSCVGGGRQRASRHLPELRRTILRQFLPDVRQGDLTSAVRTRSVLRVRCRCLFSTGLGRVVHRFLVPRCRGRRPRLSALSFSTPQDGFRRLRRHPSHLHELRRTIRRRPLSDVRPRARRRCLNANINCGRRPAASRIQCESHNGLKEVPRVRLNRVRRFRRHAHRAGWRCLHGLERELHLRRRTRDTGAACTNCGEQFEGGSCPMCGVEPEGVS